MKTKTLLTVILLSTILVSCTPASISTQTEKPIPIATITFTPIPFTPTVTPTPENLADTKGLQIWVEQYVYAYGGKISLNGTEMDASQLTDAIRTNAEAFTQVKEFMGVLYSFLVINDVPLAVQDENTEWKWKELNIDTAFAIKGKEVQVRAEPGGGKQMNGLKDFSNLMLTTTIEGWLYPKAPDGTYDFNIPDIFADITRNRIIGGQLAWGYEPALPQWVIDLPADKLQDTALSNIDTVMSHFYEKYSSKKYDWIIAGETTNPTLYFKKIGRNDTEHLYVIEQYREANSIMEKYSRTRGVDNDRLAYSDFINGVQDPKLKNIIDILSTLKNENLIDVFYLQLRYIGSPNLDPANPPSRKSLQTLADEIYRETGVKVIFSEVGIKGNGDPNIIFGNTTGACLDSDACLGVQFYSVGPDADGSLERTLFDFDQNDKSVRNSAYYNLVRLILQ